MHPKEGYEGIDNMKGRIVLIVLVIVVLIGAIGAYFYIQSQSGGDEVPESDSVTNVTVDENGVGDVAFCSDVDIEYGKKEGYSAWCYPSVHLGTTKFRISDDMDEEMFDEDYEFVGDNDVSYKP